MSETISRASVINFLQDVRARIYNNDIHGKVLLVDDTIAVVSSFNLLKNPASGLSWEAGIVTYDQNIVASINESITNIAS